jgi:hypothetical protein
METDDTISLKTAVCNSTYDVTSISRDTVKRFGALIAAG